jgi:hypothetical protein
MKTTDIKVTAPQFELLVNGEQWRQTDNLKGSAPDDRVFSLDAETGVVTFGDGIHGRRLPAGNTTIHATYKQGGGEAGAVDDEVGLSLTWKVKGFGANEVARIKIEPSVNGISCRAHREAEAPYRNKWATLLCRSIETLALRLRCRSH